MNSCSSDQGTPTFIALEVAGAPPIIRAPEMFPTGNYLHALCDTTLDPHIGDHFLRDFKEQARAYFNTHNTPVTDFENAWAQGLKPPAGVYKPCAVVHEPRHDVESMFWLLCFALARANPKSGAKNPDDTTVEYSEFCKVMLYEHEPLNLRANRGRYLEQTKEQWKAILHPKLASLSLLLHHMGQYLAIRSFDHLNNKWGPYHAHQVFKILLFSAIKTFQSGDPILLCPHVPRYSLPVPGTRTGGNTSKITGQTPPSGGSSRDSRLRKSSQAELDKDERPPKRFKGDQPARLEQEEQPITNDEVMEHLRMLRRHHLWYHTGGRTRCVHCH
jgi:hypothetical protein